MKNKFFDVLQEFKNSSVSSITIILFTLILYACGGGSSGGGGSGTTNQDRTNFPTSGQFDLVEYNFHENTQVVGGSISERIRFYSKSSADIIFDVNDEFIRSDENTIIQEVLGVLSRSYIINATSIAEVLHDIDGSSRDYQRFVNVGDQYLNADATVTLGSDQLTQNASCTVVEHLDSFDLSMQTGAFNLASGIYNDVLHMRCQTGFVDNGNIAVHSDLHHYMAKGRGIIFNQGTVLLFGDVYVIPEF